MFREANDDFLQMPEKESPDGNRPVGTKVGVWEVSSLAQNSQPVGSPSDISSNFSVTELARLRPQRDPTLPRPI